MMQKQKKPTTPTADNNLPAGTIKKVIATPNIDDVLEDVDQALDESAPTTRSGCGCWG